MPIRHRREGVGANDSDFAGASSRQCGNEEHDIWDIANLTRANKG